MSDLKRWGLALGAGLVLAACGAPEPRSNAGSTTVAAQEASRGTPLSGGRYNVTMGGTRPGKPFEITTMLTSIEVFNHTDDEVTPVCILTFGSQTALVETGGKTVGPGERVRIPGSSTFHRPLDDYESSDASCHTALPGWVPAEIERERAATTLGEPVEVPDLIGKRISSRLPNFRRGLEIKIVAETTPCSKRKLFEMSRYWGPFGKPGCGNP